MFAVDNFINGISNSTRYLTASIQDECFILSKTYYPMEDGEEEYSEEIGQVDLAKLQELSQSVSDSYTWAETTLFSKKHIEVAIQCLDRNRIIPYMRFERGTYQINEHNYHFVVSKASPEYIFSLLCSCADKPGKHDIPCHYQNTRLERTTLENLFDGFRIFTVKIDSPQEHSLSEFKRILDSYLFNISYNHNISLSVEDFSSDRRLLRISSLRDGQLFPYKHYKRDLTKYYHQAIATNLPFMQYLAFYHVAEFYFQSVSEDDAFHVISSFITRPSFSPNSQEDIRQFYEKIKRKIREQRDDGVWNEKNGLLLCLKKYVPDLDSLRTSIDNINSAAIDYYSTTQVPFADDGKCIDFDDSPEKIYISIRDRVYSTRNSIVHSKSGERLRYEPFSHDKELAKEIPLIRAIAEEIIINSAENIKYNFSVSD